MPNFICREDVDFFLNDLKWKVDDNQRELIENIYNRIHRMTTYNEYIQLSITKKPDCETILFQDNKQESHIQIPPIRYQEGYRVSYGWNDPCSGPMYLPLGDNAW